MEINTTAALENVTIPQAGDIYRARSHNNYRQNQLGLTYSKATDKKNEQLPVVSYDSDDNKGRPNNKRKRHSTQFTTNDNRNHDQTSQALSILENKFDKLTEMLTKIVDRNQVLMQTFLGSNCLSQAPDPPNQFTN